MPNWDATVRKPLDQYGEPCEHHSVPSLGHDCAYEVARNKLIPVAAAHADHERIASGANVAGDLLRRGSWAAVFFAEMDRLWLERGQGLMYAQQQVPKRQRRVVVDQFDSEPPPNHCATGAE